MYVTSWWQVKDTYSSVGREVLIFIEKRSIDIAALLFPST
jgi:hypothetical protein